MNKGKIILAKNIKYNFEDIMMEVLQNKNIIMLCDDDNSDLLCGKYITDNNFDELYAEFWKSRSNEPFPCFFVDALIYDNLTQVSIPKGKYVIQKIAKILD